MAAVIIRKKDVERFGKEVLKEVYNFLHDEYILKNFQEMELEKKKFQRNIILYDFRSHNFTETQKENHLTKEYYELDENQYKEKLKVIKDRTENGSFSNEVIFHTLSNINLDSEIDEDLYFKTNAFLDIYKVFECDCSYLED